MRMWEREEGIDIKDREGHTHTHRHILLYIRWGKEGRKEGKKAHDADAVVEEAAWRERRWRTHTQTRRHVMLSKPARAPLSSCLCPPSACHIPYIFIQAGCIKREGKFKPQILTWVFVAAICNSPHFSTADPTDSHPQPNHACLLIIYNPTPQMHTHTHR